MSNTQLQTSTPMFNNPSAKLTILPIPLFNSFSTDIIQIDVNGTRYSHCNSVAAMLGIRQVKESRKNLDISTINFHNIRLKEGLAPDRVRDKKLAVLLNINIGGTLEHSLWLTDFEALSWLYKTKKRPKDPFKEIFEKNFLYYKPITSVPIELPPMPTNVLELAERWIGTLKELEDTNKKYDLLKNEIKDHTLFAKSPIILNKNTGYLTIREIVKRFELSANVCINLLHFVGHPKCSYTTTSLCYDKLSYVENGIDDSLIKALKSTIDHQVSRSKKSLVVWHPAFNKNAIHFKPSAAIKWFNYTTADFTY